MRRILMALILAAPSIAAAQGVAVPVTLSEFKVELGRDTVPAGSVTFRLSNKGQMTHGFYVLGPGVDQGAREVPAGQTGSLTVKLKPGTYEVYCPLADNSHKMAGMDRKLVVTAAPAGPKKPGA